MSVQRLQAETSSRDFLDWQRHIEHDRNFHKRDHYYLAQIAQILAQAFSTKKYRLEDFLLRFSGAGPVSPGKTKNKNTEKSKAAWFALTGLGGELQTRTPPN